MPSEFTRRVCWSGIANVSALRLISLFLPQTLGATGVQRLRSFKTRRKMAEGRSEEPSAGAVAATVRTGHGRALESYSSYARRSDSRGGNGPGADQRRGEIHTIRSAQSGDG